MQGRLGAVMLYAEDHVALARWYEQKLGLPPAKQYEPDHLGCVHQDLYFGFNHRVPTPPPGAVALYFLVEDCDEQFDAIRSRGAHVLHEPHEAHWGARVACFLDPVGNRVWLYEYTDRE